MAFESVRVIAGGTAFAGWTSVRVTAEKGGHRSFSITASEVSKDWSRSPFDVWNFPPGTPVTVMAGGDVLVTGYVDRYMPSGSADDHRVELQGTGKSADYAVSSWVHPTGRFEDKTALQIAQELDKFGIGIFAKGIRQALLPIPWFQLRVGSTPWAEMMRLLRQQNLTMTGQADGSLAIEGGASGRHSGGLIQGHNIKEMSAVLSAATLASEYKVVGQSAAGTKDEHIRPEGTAQDGTLGRFRRRTLVDLAETSPGRAAKRARWERLRARGLSAQAQIVAPGWRDEGGRLWEVGDLVFVQSGWLKLSQDMAIQTVEFIQDNDGTVSRLELVDPQAYGDAGGRSGSGEVWQYKDGTGRPSKAG